MTVALIREDMWRDGWQDRWRVERAGAEGHLAVLVVVVVHMLLVCGYVLLGGVT
jgi:Tfp pilus assembly protein PilN